LSLVLTKAGCNVSQAVRLREVEKAHDLYSPFLSGGVQLEDVSHNKLST